MKELRKKIIGIGIQHLSPLPKHSRARLEHSNTSTGLNPASAFFHSGNGMAVSPESAFRHQGQSGNAGTDSSGIFELWLSRIKLNC